MSPESFLFIVASLFLTIDLILISKSKVKPRQSIYGFYASFIALCFILIAYFSFIASFLTDDFSLKQVYSYSSSNMSLFSKLYATWAGSAGSILLLILFTSTAWFLFRAYGYKKQDKKNLSTSAILGVVVVFFLIAAVIMDPFSRYGVNGPIEGRGLNPVLQSAWMAIHPPIVFAGYAFVLFAFALTLAKMKTGQLNYERLFNFSVRAGWLFLTLGIGLGGLWAYEVLGWGGYWSWDPIETASLLPWVALTIYFVTQSFANKKKTLIGEFAILMAFFSLMFLSALTRGGLLQSVHAYGLSASGPFILLFATGLIGYFFYLKRVTALPLFSIAIDKRSLKSWSVILAFVSLVGIFAVCFFGIVYSMIVNVVNPNATVAGVAFYNFANFPFVLGLLLASIGYFVPSKVTLNRYIMLIGVIAAFSILLILFGWPTNNILANVGLPLIAVALFLGAVSLGLATKSRNFRLFSRALIHVGLAAILLGVFVSATAQQVIVTNNVRQGLTFQALDLAITLVDCTTSVNNNSIELTQGVFPQNSQMLVDTTVSNEKNSYDAKLSVSLYSAYGLVSEPTIIRTGTDDIYIHLNVTREIYESLLNTLSGNFSKPETFVVVVQTMPMINIIWVGVSILVVGSVVSMTSLSKNKFYKEIVRDR